jgi:hypothetical protein
MTKYFIGMVGALGGMLIGAWLMLAPFALAYQHSGEVWINPTHVDFWSGLAILVVSLIGMIMYALGLVVELRSRGIIEVKETPQDRQAAEQAPTTGLLAGGTAPASSGEIEQILLPLVTAMLQDMQDQRRREQGDGASQKNAAPDQQLDSERRAQ